MFFWWSPVCHSQFRSEDVAFLAKMLGCGQDTTSYTVLCVLLLRFALPGKGPVCCIGSNITSLCGVVRLATCLRGWINSFWLPFSFVTVFVVDVVITVGFVVWDRVIGVTVSISRINLSVFSLFSLFFQQATLIPVMPWFFTVGARRFVSVSINVCGMLAHNVYLLLVWSFQTIELYFLF